jgi:hypothetical protein
MRLVGFLRHPDKRVQKAAFDLLNIFERNGPGTNAPPEAWEEWHRGLKQSLNIQEPKWNSKGLKPTDEILLEILEIRAQYPIRPTQLFVRDTPHHNALKRLVGYLRHPDRRVSVSANSTLLSIQHDRPGGIDEPERWEEWLKNLETSASVPKATPQSTEPTESTEEALLEMLSMPHKSGWGSSRASE